MRDKNKINEIGSEFHWQWPMGNGSAVNSDPWMDEPIYAGSGRDAIRALLRYGKERLGWERILVPSYLCQEVVKATAAEGMRIRLYSDDPREDITVPALHGGDVILIVNTFGIRKRWKRPATDGLGHVIEDHTHDPWSAWAKGSDADYCVASLRKTLPIPDGGVIWSPRKLPLPKPPKLTETHYLHASMKMDAMILKSLYLNGRDIKKGVFRKLAILGEKKITERDISAPHPVSIEYARCFSADPWRESRKRNYEYIIKILADSDRFKVLSPKDADSCALSIIIEFNNEKMRDDYKQKLIKADIYPAILWPLGGSSRRFPKNVELSARMLSLHCDGRYEEKDMDRIAGILMDAN